MNQDTQRIIDDTLRCYLKSHGKNPCFYLSEIDKGTRNSIINAIIKSDPTLQNIISNHVQKLINSRVQTIADAKYLECNYSVVDTITGQVHDNYWR